MDTEPLSETPEDAPGAPSATDTEAAAIVRYGHCVDPSVGRYRPRVWTVVFSNAYRRRGVSPVLLTRQDHENMVYRFPSSLADPTVEIALHGRESGKVTRQLSPLATRSDDIEDRLHDPVQIRTSWSPQSFPLGHQRRNQRLLRIAKVACILQAILISLGSRKPMNHNPLKSLNSFSVRHLDDLHKSATSPVGN